MKISYKPLWRTLLERDMQKKDLRELAGLTTNIIEKYIAESLTKSASNYLF